MVDEQRQFPRFLVHFQIYLLLDGILIGDGTGYDLSAGGCAVVSPMNLGKGYNMALQLYLPDHQDPTTPLMVKVAATRWTIQQKFGLEFLSLPIGEQQRLLQYVKALRTTIPEGRLLTLGIPGYRGEC